MRLANRYETISRWTVERYRTKIYRYSMEYLEDAFKEFAITLAVVMCLALDGTPMRLHREDSKADNMNVYVRTLTAYSINGDSISIQPGLSSPPDSKVSGILSTVPTSKLRIEELAGKPQFSIFMISCDAANVNKAAVKMLFAQLHPHKTSFCSIVAECI